MLPLALAIGLGVGIIIGMLGGGGALIAIPALMYGLQFDFRSAVASSLALVVLGAIPAIILYARNKEIVWQDVLWVGLSGMVGARIGSTLSGMIATQWLLWLLISLMLLSSLNMLGVLKIQATSPLTGDTENMRRKIGLIAGGFGVGILTGLVGVGGGFLLMPLLLILGGHPARLAIGTSLTIIALNGLSGLAGHLQALPTHTPVFWELSLSGMLGSLIGFFVGQKLNEQQLKKGFGVFLIILAAILVLIPPQH